MRQKLSKKDEQRKLNAYYKKIDEYNKLTLDELKEVLNTKKPGGMYLQALIDVTQHKLNYERVEKMKALQDTIRPQTITVSTEQQVAPEVIESEESQQTTTEQ
jgi:hypothetical protein